MKLIVLISALFIATIGFFVISNSQKKEPTKAISSTSIGPTSAHIPLSELDQSRILFIPYWGFTNKKIETNEFDRLVYFGVSTTEEDIDREDDGYKKLETFLRLIPDNRDKYLAIRMINSKTNFKVLENKKAQETIVRSSIELAKEHSFSGIVLDLEVVSLPFESILTQIDEFVALFSKESKKEKLEFSILLYGDVFHRIRPYDVKTLGQIVDNVYVMTYDFHKASGTPGPNFPFEGEKEYGYDFKKMIDDYSKIVGREKLVIVFGLYGYDWTVSDKNTVIEYGKPLSLNEAEQKFLPSCSLTDCKVSRSSSSAEISVTYKDDKDQKHIVWFEDLISMEKKREYLKTRGITKIGFWAYSYF